MFRAAKHAVLGGLVHHEIEGLKAIGVDEIQWRRGHQYLTLVYQIDRGLKRLLGVAKDRTEQSLTEFFTILGKPKSARLKFTCSDRWHQVRLDRYAKFAAVTGSKPPGGRLRREVAG